jgi:hypothetical protein
MLLLATSPWGMACWSAGLMLKLLVEGLAKSFSLLWSAFLYALECYAPISVSLHIASTAFWGMMLREPLCWCWWCLKGRI